jgi:subtilisin family serine protease
MKCASLMLIVVAMAMSGCVQPRRLAQASDHADTVQPPPATVAAMDSQRDIVLAVANPLGAPAAHAGSSLLAYGPPRYGAGQRAATDVAALKKSYRLREVTGWPIKALNVYCVVLQPPEGVTRDDLLKALVKDPRVQLAQPLQDYSVYSASSTDAHHYNDPYVNLQRGFVETDAALAHGLSQGKGVHIAVVDTGVDAAHKDLQGRIHDVHNMVDDDASVFNSDSHGTEVAGIITADGDNHQGIVGMAPDAVLSVYKACWYSPAPHSGARCNSFTLAKALAAIIDTDARIVNLSLGGPADPLLNKLLDQLLIQRRIVVAALPPDGAIDGFPDASPGVIVVRESEASKAPPGIVSAPGKDILTTQPGGGYDFTSGSSMAAAHVSGIVALMLSISPKLDAHTIHGLLLESSKVSGGTLQVNAASAVSALHATEQTTR